MPSEDSPTIYDVAELSGLSISTVSRVLNSPERVTETTREKVLAAIDELGYVPKAEARARALQSTRRIGVLTPFFTSPSFVQRLRGVAAALANSNYEMVIYPVDSLNRLRAYLAALPITSNLDCLIIMSLPFTEEDSKRLKDHNIQTVVIEFHQDYFSSVVIDDFAGGLMAANYLIKKGHRRIAFIGDLNPPDYAIKPVLKRYNGLKHGLEEAGNLLPDEYVRSASFNQVPSRQQARQLLNLPEPPTAIFAATDAQAIAVMKVTRELGLRIPNDLAVIGFDDLDMADFVGLTTISQSLDDSGRVATELLLARIAEPNRPLQMVHLPLKIVERDTV